MRAALEVPAFRRLWVVLAVSSFGDWLGLLATTGLAARLADDFRAQTYAIGGVLFVRLLPDLVLSPFAGAFADRFDRRITMVVGDLLRFALFASIPLVGTLQWLIVATFLIESVSLFWLPAKEASVPRLVPPERLESAVQINLVTTYGSAVIAAGAFAVLSVVADRLGAAVPGLGANPVQLALYFNAATFLFAALAVARIPEISGRRQSRADRASGPGLLRSILDGWAFVGHTPLVRGLIVGILGATAAGGVIIATGRLYSDQRGGGDAGYGVLFGAVFLGLAGGMALGPRLLAGLSRRRLFGMALVGAGVALALTALVADLVLAVLVVLMVGACAGVAWVSGYTLLGGEVADEVRGRTFSLLASLLRVDLLLVLSVTPFLVGAIGDQSLTLPTGGRIGLDGVSIVLFVGGLVAMLGGVLAYRQMDDRRGIPLRADLLAALRHETPPARPVGSGVFVVFEGGEGTGKSTQARLLAQRLQAGGPTAGAAPAREVVLTREPGGTPVGSRIRGLLLEPGGQLSPCTEALLYAADRAEHVAAVVRPALERDAVVISDRYVDSSLAYQGAGRVLAEHSVARLSAWATGGLVPDLTVLLDLAPADGLARAAGRGEGPDRLEAEELAFHERVRSGFLRLAAAAPARYLVVPADLPPEEVARRVAERVDALLARSAPEPTRAAPEQTVPVGGER
ncbi:MAG: dTMP kinase [Actinomycetota bacterium]|nr:dTMP kinase [Actinomycetota bacterium]